MEPTTNPTPDATPSPPPPLFPSSPFFAFLSLSFVPSLSTFSFFFNPIHLLNMSSAKVYVGACAGPFDL